MWGGVVAPSRDSLDGSAVSLGDGVEVELSQRLIEGEDDGRFEF